MQASERPVQRGSGDPGNNARQRQRNVAQCNGSHTGIEHDSSQRQDQHIRRQSKNGSAMKIGSHGKYQHSLSDGGDQNQFIQRQDATAPAESP